MAKVTLDLEAMKAEFAARGGKVQTIAVGERAIESDRTIYAAMREGKRAVSDAVARERIMESRAERAADAARETRFLGGSAEDAYAAYEYEMSR